MKKGIILLVIIGSILTTSCTNIGVNDTVSTSTPISSSNTSIHCTDISYANENFTIVEEPTQTPDIATTTNYAQLMFDAIVSRDYEAGYEAEQERNDKIDKLKLDEIKISFKDLLLLSKLIFAEGGSNWLSDEWKMADGEVLLNRVASPEFPNTIEECIYQKGQYGAVTRGIFESLIPTMREISIAWRLLNGERILVPSVVFQAEFRQGSGTYLKLTDSILGTTYFCYSSHPELYEGVNN